jgi:hypothetical protein
LAAGDAVIDCDRAGETEEAIEPRHQSECIAS